LFVVPTFMVCNCPCSAAGTMILVSVLKGFLPSAEGLLPEGRLIVSVMGASLVSDKTVLNPNPLSFGLYDSHLSAPLSFDDAIRDRDALGRAWFLISEANLSTLVLGAHTTKQNPTLMDIKVEARINQPVGRISLALKNWVTGAWETVEVQETRSNEDITYWKTGIPCRDYVRPDGRIELQIKTVVNVPITEATFRAFLDQVDIQIRDI
jgi:hypothetical protein